MTRLATPFRSGLMSAAQAAKIGFEYSSTDTADLNYVDGISAYKLNLYKYGKVVHGSLELDGDLDNPGVNPVEISVSDSRFLNVGSNVSTFFMVSNYGGSADTLFECHVTNSLLKIYLADGTDYTNDALIAIGNFIGPCSFLYVLE